MLFLAIKPSITLSLVFREVPIDEVLGINLRKSNITLGSERVKLLTLTCLNPGHDTHQRQKTPYHLHLHCLSMK